MMPMKDKQQKNIGWFRLFGVWLFFVWLAAVYATITAYSWLEEYRLAGVVVIGLLFLGVGFIGLYLELQQMWLFDRLRKRQVVRLLGGLLMLVVGFPLGLWLVVVSSQFFLGYLLGLSDTAVYIGYIGFALGYIRFFISTITWFSENRYLDWWAD
jgi:hypothetical protein